MNQTERWLITGGGPEDYERYTVGGYLGALAEEFLVEVKMRLGDRVLDVACGTGIVARLAALRVGTTGTVTGFDINPEMLAHAKSLASSAGLDIAWRHGDAAALPFADAAFDLVLCQQGLQFMPDKLQALREMHRVLAQHGRLALNVSGPPNEFQLALADALETYVDAAVARTSLAPFATHDPEMLRDTATAAGFENVELQTMTRSRYVVPSQEWLLEYTAGLPYAAAICRTPPEMRATLMRDVAARLKSYWIVDRFEVPWVVFMLTARR